jgi:hypothetical protein
MTRYADILSHPARAIDATVKANIFPVIESDDEESVFNYIDTASSRASINVVSRKLELGKIAIVGLGGTGSYVLDLVAKTPVKEIHLFDGDEFLQHNAFRAPGAPSILELKRKSPKVKFFRRIYSRMHRHIAAHNYNIDLSNVDQLREMDFVFLCLDKGAAKKVIITKLEGYNIPFIDVGMGIEENDGSLGGILRVTTSTVKQREHVGKRIPLSDDDQNNDYSRNIQVADLNALNAAFAVLKWKKLLGFYRDFENEYHSTYTIDCSMLHNDDKL